MKIEIKEKSSREEFREVIAARGGGGGGRGVIGGEAGGGGGVGWEGQWQVVEKQEYAVKREKLCSNFAQNHCYFL